MTATTAAHATTLALSDPAPSAVAVGSTFAVKVNVKCCEGCDLRGARVVVTAPDGTTTTSALGDFDGVGSETGEITLTAPPTLGEHVWTFAVACEDGVDIIHDGTLRLRVGTRPQDSSLAVWSIPSPVVAGEPFEIAVGAKSAGACVLTGKQIEVCDANGGVLARSQLGATPWPGTSALYWAPVALRAPDAAGMYAWSVRFAATDVELPHTGSSATFSVVVARPPEHRLTVKVVAKETAAPIENAQVRLGPYQAVTDPAGLAQVHMPSGHYDLVIWKVGYQAPPRTVEVGADEAIEVELVTLPEENYDTYWRM